MSKHRDLKATDLFGATVGMSVYAYLTSTHRERKAGCPVFFRLNAGGLGVDFSMTPDEARKLAQALTDSATDAESIDRTHAAGEAA